MAKDLERLASVAIVGRPNVGKSTLFNRLVGKRLALVDDRPGVTRDRREGEAILFDLRFQVIDTAGLEQADPESLAGRMSAQSERAIEEADLTLLLIDARAGVTPSDAHFAAALRKRGAAVLLLANKCEGRAAEAGLAEAWSLGLGEPLPISAEHGLGLSELHEALKAKLCPAGTAGEAQPGKEEEAAQAPAGPLQIAIIGRPNVGKSTLANALIREERMLTGPEAGITRDAIAIEWDYQGRAVRLIDTAGLRRRARVEDQVERLSAADTKRAIDFAQVTILMIDAQEGLEKQDLTIARQVVEEGRALVLALNKWDAVADQQAAARVVRDRLTRSLPQLRGLAVVPISALQRRGLDHLMQAVFAAYEVWNRRLPTAPLNRWLEAVTQAHPPPLVSGRRVKLRYITQPKARPPTFAIFTTRPEALPASYLRYLENALRKDFDLFGVPIRILLRKGRNPYA